jgi:AcrR family transcriptional regulator
VTAAGGRAVAGGPRARRQERGRLEILQAAAGLLAANGYHGMSMRDLSRAAGMSLANLYNYFPAKEDLVFALQTRAFETLIASAVEATGGVRGGTARLHAFILGHVRYVASHRDVMRVLVEEAGELPAPRRRAIRALKERYFLLGREIVAGLVAGGRRATRAAGDEIDRSTFAIFGMLNWVYAWYDPGRHGHPHDVARTIHRIALSGLVARSPSRAAQSATERAMDRIGVRSPIQSRPARGAS